MDLSLPPRLDARPCAVDAPPRIDIYGAVHKGLRLFMSDTLARVGRADPGDAAEVSEALAQARSLLAICGEHLQHENGFVHEAMEARRPGAASRTSTDHVGHESAIEALAQAIDALESGPRPASPAAMHRLYLRLARFVADNLEHMEVEETHNTAVLHDAYTDAEIAAMLQRLLATIPPASAAVFHRWIYAATTHAERAGMLGEIRAHAPSEVFAAEIALAREVIAPRDWVKLARALSLPAGAAVSEPW